MPTYTYTHLLIRPKNISSRFLFVFYSSQFILCRKPIENINDNIHKSKKSISYYPLNYYEETCVSSTITLLYMLTLWLVNHYLAPLIIWPLSVHMIYPYQSLVFLIDQLTWTFLSICYVVYRKEQHKRTTEVIFKCRYLTMDSILLSKAMVTSKY